MAFGKAVAAFFSTMSVVISLHAAAPTEGSNSEDGSRERPAPALAAPRTASRGSRAEERRYAEREAASPAAKNYRAGSVVVISASALAVILLVIIIIILI